MQHRIITSREAGGRLDKYLGRYLKEAPVSFLYKMLRKKNITLNGKKAAGSELLKEGDELRLFLSDETILKFGGTLFSVPPASAFLWNQPEPEILYEDEQVLILNKPVGVLSQKARKEDVTLTEWIRHYLEESGSLTPSEQSVFQPGVCNRLDRNTSGIILAGKTLYGLQTLSRMLAERTVHKYYLALVVGKITEKKKIEGYLYKKEQHNTVEIYDSFREGASLIQTEYEPLAVSKEENYTLLMVNLITGKSHQIRAHLASIGHPIVGDGKYGYRKTNECFRRYGLTSQFLHAWKLVFPIQTELPNLSGQVIQAKLPPVLEQILKKKVGNTYAVLEFKRASGVYPRRADQFNQQQI